jgi:hypothetical protein
MKRDWIKAAIKHPGALHAELHVAESAPIPADKLAHAAKADGKLGRRARLALILRGLAQSNHKDD